MTIANNLAYVSVDMCGPPKQSLRDWAKKHRYPELDYVFSDEKSATEFIKSRFDPLLTTK